MKRYHLKKSIYIPILLFWFSYVVFALLAYNPDEPEIDYYYFLYICFFILLTIMIKFFKI